MVGIIVAILLGLGTWVFTQSKNIAVMEEKVTRHEQVFPKIQSIADGLKALREEQHASLEHIRETIDLKYKNLELLIESN